MADNRTVRLNARAYIMTKVTSGAPSSVCNEGPRPRCGYVAPYLHLHNNDLTRSVEQYERQGDGLRG